MKIVSAIEAVRQIKDGDTIATAGGVGIGFAEYVVKTLGELEDGPKGLTLVHAAGQGDGGDRGLNHLARPGLLKRVIGGHWGLAPKLQALANANEIEAYNIPQGVMAHLYRDIAAHRPGHLTKIGVGTFADPILGGGILNSKITKRIVQSVEINGEHYLFYPSFPINVGIIRATASDPQGNLTMENEALTIDAMSVAMATHNSGGIVIAQVKYVQSKAMSEVKVPGIFVDYLVICDEPSGHPYTFETDQHRPIDIPPISDRDRAIASRAIKELRHGNVVNLGIGIPMSIATMEYRQEIPVSIILTNESGSIGGIPYGGLNFGASKYPQAIIDQPYMFDFYDGGGIDVAFLGFAEVDQKGNVNVSKFKDRIPGAGGFINISQRAKKVVFVGSLLTSKGEKKFVKDVSQITFNSSINPGREILYITERCVFRLENGIVRLIEVYDDYSYDLDIMPHLDFVP